MTIKQWNATLNYCKMLGITNLKELQAFNRKEWYRGNNVFARLKSYFEEMMRI